MLNCVSEGALLNHSLSEAMHAAHSAVDPGKASGRLDSEAVLLERSPPHSSGTAGHMEARGHTFLRQCVPLGQRQRSSGPQTQRRRN